MVKSKFTSAEKSRTILESLDTNIRTAEICRKYNITPQIFYSWREKICQIIAAGCKTPNGNITNLPNIDSYSVGATVHNPDGTSRKF